MSDFASVIVILIVGRAMTQIGLSELNRRYVCRHAKIIPDAFRGIFNQETYDRSIAYTLAKTRFAMVSDIFDAFILITLLYGGLLPWTFRKFSTAIGTSVYAMSGFLFLAGLALSLLELPLAAYAQFKLEERFGFNTTTVKTWLMDRMKGLVLSLLLAFPVLLLVLKLIEWTGVFWWVWAAAMVALVQLLILLIAPAVILPLFNRFTPLPAGSLRDRLNALARRTDFPIQNIEVMDGSKRSRHSNAFFTGFGKFRKIALFDTLVAQLSESELEAVLAHEIGHFKKRHIHKLLAISLVGLVAAFALVAWLARQEWFYRAFGFTEDPAITAAGMAPALLLFGLLAGTVTFWLSPISHLWSRRFEFEADAFARATMGGSESLIQALRKLSENNLSNLTPHPIYSGFYYSHPTLLERERALRLSG